MNRKETLTGHVRIWDELIELAKTKRERLETLAKAGVKMLDEAGNDTLPSRIASANSDELEYGKHRVLAQQRLNAAM